MHHPVTGFEHLHKHSDFSLMDGFAKVHEYAERQKEINQKYLCITDHGVMGAVPQQVKECEKHNLYPLFGCELYVNSMQPKVESRSESAAFRKSLGNDVDKKSPEQVKFDKSCHLLAIAYTNDGYKNLVRLTSWAWIHGYYRKPRVNHDILMQYKEGIIFTSTCGNSEIAYALFNEGEDAAFQMLEKYIAMFSPHFYLELMMLDWKMQKPYDVFLLKAHDKYGLPLIMTQDCFTEGTMVLTDMGYVSIEEVRPCHTVLTHRNRFREVEIIGSRPLRKGEQVLRIKTLVGSYAFDLTDSHKLFTAKRHTDSWDFEWKKTKNITTDDFLLVPKINPNFVFSSKSARRIDLLDFIPSGDYQIGEDYKSSTKGNMGCRLQYSSKSEEFISYRGWDRKNKTVIPRYLNIDTDLLDIIGWYIAEGWSEEGSNQVGFALHEEEQDVADWIISYFDKFGIKAKTYKVSEHGIAVRFSSVVFNQLFATMCGKGANNKHLPFLNGAEWMKRWSKSQLLRILSKYWKGDGHGDESATTFSSTSKTIMFEIATVFNAMGMFVYPSVEKARKSTWSDKWYITVAESKTKVIHEWFDGKLESFSDPRPRGVKYFDTGEYYAVRVKSVEPIKYNGLVYDFQVSEDHSFTANLFVSSNCHYCMKEHSHNQRLQLMQQNRRTIQEINALIESGEADDLFELQDTNLWLKSEDELNTKWESDYKDIIDYELYKQSKLNTIALCEKAKGVEIDRSIKLPKVPDSDAVLWEEIKKGFVSRHCPRTPVYSKRIKEEYELICEKGFSSYFLIQKMMTDEARSEGPKIVGFGDGSEAVGPGRGSVCGSLVAYVLRLHDVEPIHHDLRFSRFLSPARGGKQMKIRHTLEPIAEEEVQL